MGECVREGGGNRDGNSQILPIFTGSSPGCGKGRWVAAPRECRGQPGIGLDCGRGANSWPCLSPQLLPLLTKIKANRDKSRFNEPRPPPDFPGAGA